MIDRPYTMVTEITDEVRDFITCKLGPRAISDTTSVLAFKDEKGIMGGWMFERFTGIGGSVTVHWAGRDGRWLRVGMLEMCAHYIFEQLGCACAIGEVEESDKRTRRIDERLGFEQVGLIPGYFPNDNLVIYRLTRSNCRFLRANMESSNGQTQST